MTDGIQGHRPVVLSTSSSSWQAEMAGFNQSNTCQVNILQGLLVETTNPMKTTRG